MKNKSKITGQSMVLMLILLLPITIAVLSNLSIQNMGNKKIKAQTQNDHHLLLSLSTQAKALNTIAAYNHMLEVIGQNVFAYSTVILGLRLCAATVVFGNKACLKAWARAEKTSPKFYKKVNKLLEHIKSTQDALLKIANQSPGLMVTQITLLSKFNPALSLIYPNGLNTHYALPISRAFQTQSNQEMSGFLERGDLSKCKKINYQTKSQFTRSLSSILNQFNAGDTLTVTFQNINADSQTYRFTSKNEIIEFFFKEKRLFTYDDQYIFKKAVYTKCETLGRLMHDLNILSGVSIPAPYLFNSQVSTQNTYTLHANEVFGNEIDNNMFLQSDLISNQEFHSFTIKTKSHAKLVGQDLMNMEFDFILSKDHPCTLQKGCFK